MIFSSQTHIAKGSELNDRKQVRNNCLVCGGSDWRRVYDLLRKCQNCDFVWYGEELSDEMLATIYGNSYFFGEEYHNYLNEEKNLRKDFQNLLGSLKRFAPAGRLLEIGCGYGFFLDVARQAYDVIGVDINSEACKYARERFGLEVTCGDFLKMDFKPDTFDLIVSWATIEHLNNPGLYIQKAKSLLKPGGYFSCTTPDIGSIVAKFRGSKWRQIHPPTHVNYFSKNTLELLLKKNGFTSIEIANVGQHRSLDLVLYSILVLRHGFNRFYEFLRKFPIEGVSFYLNTFDTMFVVAQKGYEVAC